MKKASVVGIDLAKNIFQVHGCDKDGRFVLSKKVSRNQLVKLIQQLEPCTIGMEACGGAHHWARRFKEMGHEVKLVAPQFVKPYVRGDKTDQNDAAAIVECITRPRTRFVAVKSVAQQELQALHRIRARLVKNRTALSNEIRGILAEFGYVIRTGYAALKKAVLDISSDEESILSRNTRNVLLELRSEFLILDERIGSYEQEFERLCRDNDVCRRLIKIPGVGPITATAIWAHVGNGQNFKNGRQFSAYIGLVPRQHSSGGKVQHLGISKRGDRYLRQLLIHGARAVIRNLAGKTDPRSLWVQKLDIQRGRNKACVALANKNARVIWALMTSGEEYRASQAA